MAEFVEFKKATLQDMVSYIEENAQKDKAWFKSVAYDTRKKKVAVPVLDKDGKPITYQEKDKAGNLKFKDGKPVIRQKMKMVETADGEEKAVFNLLKAKRAFYSKYFPALLPVAEDKPKASDLLKDW